MKEMILKWVMDAKRMMEIDKKSEKAGDWKINLHPLLVLGYCAIALKQIFFSEFNGLYTVSTGLKGHDFLLSIFLSTGTKAKILSFSFFSFN
jgi:hypothetical protein